MPDTKSNAPPPPSSAAFAPSGGAARGLLSRSFLALLVTQFLVALNDNLFRWLIVPIGKDVMPDPDVARALGLAAITSPFLLFAAFAGYLADRFSKRQVMIACKVAEIVIMALGVAAILGGNPYGMFAVLFLMGAQSAMFSPAKYGSIPEIVREDRLSAANGLIGLTTMAAIIVGAWAGGVLYAATTLRGGGVCLHELLHALDDAANAPAGAGPPGTHRWWISAAALLGVALIGWLASLFIGRLRPANPARRFPFDFVGQTVRDLRTLVSHRGLFLVALGSSFFWGLGALAQVNVDKFAQEVLCVPQEQVGPLLAVLVLGIGIGNLLAGILSAGRIELGIVPWGAAGIVVTSMLLATVPGSAPENPDNAAYGWACFWLLMLGIGAGLYDVPFQAYLQHNSPPERRGSILAAYNFLAFAAMLSASPIFGFLGSVCGLSARAISVAAGLGTLPVLVCIVLLIPRDTLRFILRTTMRLLYRVRVEGLENLPAEGGYLLTPNHVTWIDGFLIVLSLPKRVRFIVFADYFSGRFSRWFGRMAEVIPIQPGKRSVVESLRRAREALQSGDAIGIFPEGEITRSGQMQEFKPGFLKVVRGTGAPVIPVYLGGLWGSNFSNSGGRFFWKWPRRWRYPVLIRIGRPIYNPSGVEEVREAVVKLGEGKAAAERKPP